MKQRQSHPTQRRCGVCRSSISFQLISSPPQHIEQKLWPLGWPLREEVATEGAVDQEVVARLYTRQSDVTRDGAGSAPDLHVDDRRFQCLPLRSVRRQSEGRRQR